jgi:uncharacterized protein (TIGR02147 family)
LKGDKNLSPSNAELIADRLFSTSERKQLFVGLVEYAVAKKAAIRNRALGKIRNIEGVLGDEIVPLDDFKFISNWYHYAILGLVRLPQFRYNLSWIARELGISRSEAKDAIERMINMGFLKESGEKLVRTNKKISTPSNVSSEGLREHHRQMIGKALESIDSQDVDSRYLRSKTFVITKDEYSELTDLIEGFMERVSQATLNEKRKEKLYQLNTQLFELKRGES